MYYVYVLRNQQRKPSFYIGFTLDPQERCQQHNQGKVPSTRKFRPWKLVYIEGYQNKQDALKREKFLKSGGGYRFIKRQIKYFLESEDGFIE